MIRRERRSLPWSSAAQLWSVVVACLMMFPAVSTAQEETAPRIQRVSQSSNGTVGNGNSVFNEISADGRFVVFTSAASNLVPGDTNVSQDVFGREVGGGRVELISAASDGRPPEFSKSGSPAVSANGRFVAFTSGAGLVPGDTNSRFDVFVRDRETGRTEIVSRASDGSQSTWETTSESISADGRFVTFLVIEPLLPQDTNGAADVYLRDRRTGHLEIVSTTSAGEQGNSVSFESKIVAGGRFVAFLSRATNLVPGDTNDLLDLFVKDRVTGTVERVSAAGGIQGNSHVSDFDYDISSDGRWVSFLSGATNLVPEDTDGGAGDIYLKDRRTGQLSLVSVAGDGVQDDTIKGWTSISDDGRLSTFIESIEIFLPNGDNDFVSNIYVRDMVAGRTDLVSMTRNGTKGNGSSFVPSLSVDGRVVSFASLATDLTPFPDTNGLNDIFVRTFAPASSAAGPLR
jgi:Tol biopolymer transport system component